MGADSGKMKIMSASRAAIEAQKGADKAPTDDQALDQKRHERGYNPVDEAERGSISSKLNEDAGRYKKGPGPM